MTDSLISPQSGRVVPATAVVFDFDGTLARLALDFADMKRRLAALAESFLPARPEPGPLPVLEWLDELAAEVAVHEGPDTGREFHTRARFLILTMELDAAREGNLFPFARPLLAGLRRRSVSVGVITRNSGVAVRKVFPDWAEYAGVLLAREDVDRVKPDPDHLLEAMRRLGATAGATLMVGDHPLDIETARRAGVRACGVASGASPAEALALAGADYVAPDVPCLLAVLEREGVLPADG
jgi:phosphoglycolate phosphatase